VWVAEVALSKKTGPNKLRSTIFCGGEEATIIAFHHDTFLPLVNGQIERMNRAIKSAAVKHCYYHYCCNREVTSPT